MNPKSSSPLVSIISYRHKKNRDFIGLYFMVSCMALLWSRHFTLHKNIIFNTQGQLFLRVTLEESFQSDEDPISLARKLLPLIDYQTSVPQFHSMNIMKGTRGTRSRSYINYPQESKFKIYVLLSFLDTQRQISLSMSYVTEKGGKRNDEKEQKERTGWFRLCYRLAVFPSRSATRLDCHIRSYL